MSNAPLMAIAPNLGAGMLDKLPRKLPIGVLAAETINTSFMIFNRDLNFKILFAKVQKKTHFLKSVFYVYNQ